MVKCQTVPMVTCQDWFPLCRDGRGWSWQVPRFTLLVGFGPSAKNSCHSSDFLGRLLFVMFWLAEAALLIDSPHPSLVWIPCSLSQVHVLCLRYMLSVSGTWSSSPSLQMLPEPTCLRRVQPILSTRMSRSVCSASFPKPKLSASWSTQPRGPTPGTR